LRKNSKYILYEAILIVLLATGIYASYLYVASIRNNPYASIMNNPYASTRNNPYNTFKSISNYTVLQENYGSSQYSCTNIDNSNVSKVCTEIFNFTASRPNSSNATKMPMRIVVAYYLFGNNQSIQLFMHNILDNSFLQVSNITYDNFTFTYSMAQFVNGYKVFTGYVPNGVSMFEVAALDNNTDSNSTEAEYIIEQIVSLIASSSNKG